jgi:hypothetical protein
MGSACEYKRTFKVNMEGDSRLMESKRVGQKVDFYAMKEERLQREEAKLR